MTSTNWTSYSHLFTYLVRLHRVWVCTDTQAGYLLSVIVHWGSKTVPKSTASRPRVRSPICCQPPSCSVYCTCSLLLIRRCSTDSSPTTESRDSPRCNYPVNTSTHPLSSHDIKAARLRRLLGAKAAIKPLPSASAAVTAQNHQASWQGSLSLSTPPLPVGLPPLRAPPAAGAPSFADARLTRRRHALLPQSRNPITPAVPERHDYEAHREELENVQNPLIHAPCEANPRRHSKVKALVTLLLERIALTSVGHCDSSILRSRSRGCSSRTTHTRALITRTTVVHSK